jgi:aminotransferase
LGAFYAFPDVSGTGFDGHRLAEALLADAGVCVLPGTAFGQAGRDHVRISYATSPQNLAEAARRIRDFLAVGMRSEDRA